MDMKDDNDVKMTGDELQDKQHHDKSSIIEFDCKMIPNPISNMKRTKVICITGPPGSGKDSVVQELLKTTNYYHLSTGDIFRREIRKQTELGKKLDQCMSKGQFPPENLVTAVVFTLLNEQIDRVVILNGYPRTDNQASQLVRFADVDKFISIITHEKICRMRIDNRWIDPETGRVFTGNESGKLSRRPYDDDQDNLNKRFRFYYDTQPAIMSYFRSVRRVVDGNRPLKYVVGKVREKLEEPDLNDNPYCAKCTFNISSQMHVPCGHIVWCAQCAPKLNTSPCACNQCGEFITSYISLEIRKRMMDTDNCIGNDKYVLSAQLCDPCVKDDDTTNVCFSVQTENISTCFPCHICCVVDTSGSMGKPAVYEDIDGQEKPDGEGSVLDIAKRSVKTIIDCLTDKDTFSLVEFNSGAQTKYDAALMTSANKILAKTKVDELYSTGSTQMWKGIEQGINAMKHLYGRKSIFFLTDGEPDPDDTVESKLQEHKKNVGDAMLRIHPIGFGVSLKRGLLPNIAKIANGMYAFVPDSSMLASTLIRMIGNLRNEEAINPKLKLTLLNGAGFNGSIKNFMNDSVNINEQVRIVNLNSLQFGQTRDVVVPILLPADIFSVMDNKFNKPYMRAELVFEEKNQLTLDCDTIQTSPHAKLAFLRTDMVYKLNDELNKTILNIIPDTEIIKKLIEFMGQREDWHEHVRLILNDLNGRIIKGFIPEKYKVWGYHYIAAFVRAHELQLCISGLDTSPAIYSNILLQAYLTYGKNRYLSPENAPKLLPKPQSTDNQSTYNQSAYRQPVYLGGGGGGGGGGCYGPFCEVHTLDNNVISRKFIKDLVPGDLVKVSDGFATVKYVAAISHQAEVMCFNNGLVITPTHPVRSNGKWLKASNLNGKINNIKIDKVYNVVMDSCHILLVNGIECITWGHDFTGQLYHPFYGSSKKIESYLSKLNTENGVTIINGFVRNDNNHVIGFS